MINNVVLVGRLTRDVELRYTSNNTAVGNFTLALDRPFTNKSGERETDFINCQIWRKSAESLAEFTRKGSLIGVQGHIQTRNYMNNENQKVYVTEVVVGSYRLLESKNKTNTAPSNPPQANTQTTCQTTQNQSNQSDMSDYGSSVDIDDDDLPF